MFFVKTTKFINKITSEIASWTVFAMMMLAVVDVLGRYIFKQPIAGSQDLTQLMMVVMVFLGFGIEAQEDGNVRIEIFYQHFGKKTKAVMNILACLIGATGYSLVAYRLMVRALGVFAKHNAATMTLGISLAPFLTLAAVGCALLVLQMVSNIIINVMVLCNKDEKLAALDEGGNDK